MLGLSPFDYHSTMAVPCQYVPSGSTAMVSELDKAVGAVHDALKVTGMLDNSIIVFSTDNGGPANGFDYNAANNFPLR